jgi:hypothetical protein
LIPLTTCPLRTSRQAMIRLESTEILEPTDKTRHRETETQ